MTIVRLLLLATMISSCVSSQRDYTPYELEHWLTKPFGDAVTIDSTNFYYSNNPWSCCDQRAISVASGTVYYAFTRSLPGPKYQIVGEVLTYEDCPGLQDAAVLFTSKLDAYEGDPNVAWSEAESWLDGPTYHIDRFNKAGERFFSTSKLYNYGRSASLGHEVVSVADGCYDKINP